ncbi:MAG: M15 family metallopeptidase [Acidimicrobiia bacterium]
MWGYYCKFKSGTSQYSTHAWGIAVDQNARYEHLHCHVHTINNNVKNVWETHGWSWGLSFCDPMHFQYADGYSDRSASCGIDREHASGGDSAVEVPGLCRRHAGDRSCRLCRRPGHRRLPRDPVGGSEHTERAEGQGRRHGQR